MEDRAWEAKKGNWAPASKASAGDMLGNGMILGGKTGPWRQRKGIGPQLNRYQLIKIE